MCIFISAKSNLGQTCLCNGMHSKQSDNVYLSQNNKQDKSLNKKINNRQYRGRIAVHPQ